MPELPATGGPPPGPVLDGIVVADFSRHMSAPYATVMLGDFGADVVKVESVPDGDPARHTGSAYLDGESGLFLQWNRNKRSIAVDLRRPEGLEIAHRLIDRSDVLVENYRPGVAEAIGIGYEAVAERNPRLVYCSLSAFGREGPLSGNPATDPIVQALSGVMSVTGEPDGDPDLVGVPIGDFSGAMALVQGVLLGLLGRERTGRGQRVEIPMLGALMFSLTTRLASYWIDGLDSRRYGSAHSVVTPYEAYRTADGVAVAGVWAPEAWPRFCRAVGLPELEKDERFATNLDRMAHRAELRAILTEVFAGHTTGHWQERFDAEGAMFGEVCTISRALQHPQTEALHLVRSVRHSRLGDIPQMISPVRLSESPADIRRPPPLYGEHTVDVLSMLGYAENEIGTLVDDGVVDRAPPRPEERTGSCQGM